MEAPPPWVRYLNIPPCGKWLGIGAWGASSAGSSGQGGSTCVVEEAVDVCSEKLVARLAGRLLGDFSALVKLLAHLFGAAAAAAAAAAAVQQDSGVH
jgi:hypothetical protein